MVFLRINVSGVERPGWVGDGVAPAASGGLNDPKENDKPTKLLRIKSIPCIAACFAFVQTGSRAGQFILTQISERQIASFAVGVLLVFAVDTRWRIFIWNESIGDDSSNGLNHHKTGREKCGRLPKTSFAAGRPSHLRVESQRAQRIRHFGHFYFYLLPVGPTFCCRVSVWPRWLASCLSKRT